MLSVSWYTIQIPKSIDQQKKQEEQSNYLRDCRSGTHRRCLSAPFVRRKPRILPRSLLLLLLHARFLSRSLSRSGRSGDQFEFGCIFFHALCWLCSKVDISLIGLTAAMYNLIGRCRKNFH